MPEQKEEKFCGIQIGDIVLDNGRWYRVLDTWEAQNETGDAHYPLEYALDDIYEDEPLNLLQKGYYRLCTIKNGKEVYSTHWKSLTKVQDWDGKVKRGHPAYEEALDLMRACLQDDRQWHNVRPALDTLIAATRNEVEGPDLENFGPSKKPGSVKEWRSTPKNVNWAPPLPEKVAEVVQEYGKSMFKSGLGAGLEVAEQVLTASTTSEFEDPETLRAWAKNEFTLTLEKYP